MLTEKELTKIKDLAIAKDKIDEEINLLCSEAGRLHVTIREKQLNLQYDYMKYATTVIPVETMKRLMIDELKRMHSNVRADLAKYTKID